MSLLYPRPLPRGIARLCPCRDHTLIRYNVCNHYISRSGKPGRNVKHHPSPARYGHLMQVPPNHNHQCHTGSASSPVKSTTHCTWMTSDTLVGSSAAFGLSWELGLDSGGVIPNFTCTGHEFLCGAPWLRPCGGVGTARSQIQERGKGFPITPVFGRGGGAGGCV